MRPDNRLASLEEIDGLSGKSRGRNLGDASESSYSPKWDGYGDVLLRVWAEDTAKIYAASLNNRHIQAHDSVVALVEQVWWIPGKVFEPQLNDFICLKSVTE